MTREVTRLGNDLLSEAAWGTHLCHFYQTEEDLIDVLVPYFKAGLENNECCIWITAEPLSVEDAKASLKRAVKNLDDYIEKDQMEIIDYRQWYTKSGRFDAEEVVQRWTEKEYQVLKRGFNGLRVTGNTSWLDQTHWKDFMQYEATMDNIINRHRMVAVCSYALEKCGAAEVLDVISTHALALVPRSGEWELIENARCKRMEESLRGTEQMLAGVLNSVTDCISMVDETFTLVWVNDVATRPFGPDLIGKKCYSAYRGRDSERQNDDLSFYASFFFSNPCSISSVVFSAASFGSLAMRIGLPTTR